MPNQDFPDLTATRMTVIVNRNILTAAQCTCQGIHSCIEYSQKFFTDPDYQKWANYDKTIIVLEATLIDIKKIIQILEENNIKWVGFYEPDLNDILTSISIQPMTKEQSYVYFGKLKLLMND